MKNKALLLLILFTLSFSKQLDAQTQVVNHSVPFSSGMQNMWGPSWSDFSMNQTIELFDISWNESFDTGNGGIITILKQKFGAAVSGGISGGLGSSFSLTGFTTGEVQVDYPVDIELTMSDDNTYDQGDDVVIETDYTVESGWALDTYYPNAGEASLDLYMEFGASLSATLCAFGCTTFPIIPSFNTGLINLNIFTINTSGVDLFTLSAGGLTIGPLESYPGFPFSTSDYTPNPLDDYGFTGTIDLPHVTTSDYLESGTDNLVACGNDTYLEIEQNIFKLFKDIPKVGIILENLSGSEDFLGGLVNVAWNFFSASFNADIHNNQCFRFDPTIYGKFEFPVAVDYTVRNSSGGTVSSGTSSIVNVEIGHDLHYKFPCYYDRLDIITTYSIDGQFTNHTYDSIAFYVAMSALEFSLTISPIEITPEIHVPEICIPYAYPCPSWSKPWRWCTGQACTPSFTIPAVGYSGTSFGLGPLWSTEIPIGSIEYDWYHETWTLEGFSEYTQTPFSMFANPLSVTTTQTDIACFGDNTGSIDITTHAISPATPYTYVWTNGETTQDISNLEAGAYEVEVYDANDCNLFTGATILEPEQPLSVTYTKIDKTCNGGVNNGSIDILIQGGTSPYTQAWSNGSTSEDISGLAAGVYTVVITDAQGCTIPLSVTINEPSVLGQNGVVTDVNCKGGSDGAIVVDTYGGTLPYSYSWSSSHTTEDINGLIAGNYTLTITDAKSCESTLLYVVDEPLLDLTLTATKTDVLCKYDSTGAIDVSTVGGTPGYSYTWTNSQGVVLPFQTEDIINLPADTYTVNVTDDNGCRANLSTVIVEPAQELQSNPITQNINCFGDATGVIDPQISGGATPYNYSWSDGSTGATLTNVVAGTYLLTITDNNGCTEEFSYVLTEPEEALDLVLSGVDINCFGDATGSVSSSVTGGTTDYTYLWNTGETIVNIDNLTAGTYTLTVTDSKGCTVSDNVTLTQPIAPLSLTSTVVDVDCYGANTGSIDLSPTGGTAPYEYYWSNGGSIVMIDDVQDVSGLYTDNYDVLVTDAHGCEESLNSVVNQPSAPISVTALVDDVNCFGMNDGGIDIEVTGGTALSGYTYSWSNGASTQDVSGVTAGSYTVTVTDDNNCTLIETFIVSEPEEALVAEVTPTHVKCNGGSSGMISSEVTGGTAPYTYVWSTSETEEEIFNLSAGSYSLTVTDAQGCTSFTGTVINEPAQPLVVATTVIDAQCYGNSDGSIQINITGGAEPYYFNWGNQNEILVNNFSETITDLNIGEYFIRVTDRNGCKNEQYVMVNQPQPLEVTHALTEVVCFGGNTGAADITISGGTPTYTTTWSNGETTEDVSSLVSGTYTVDIVDSQGCETSDTMFIDQPDLLEVAYEVVEVSCIDQSDAAIYVSAFGGINPIVYDWSNGATTQNIENLEPGIYELIITDANSCTSNHTFEVIDNNTECVFIPNTFTPNGDFYNDTWMIRNIELYPNASVKVFNKWGNNVFDSKGTYKPWDGTHNGEPLPSDVYYYIILLENSEENEYSGTITIIR